MYLRDELLFNFDEEGVVNTPMNFEICKSTEEAIDSKLPVIIILWIFDIGAMVILFWAFK